MNVIVATPKQPSILNLAGTLLGRIFKARTARPRARYVNMGEFSEHLQRDMGFLDGRGAPEPECRLDARDIETRDLLR